MFEETPHASGLAAGFFFSGRWNQFAATRIALAWKIGTPTFLGSVPPVGRGFFPFCIAMRTSTTLADFERHGIPKSVFL